MNRLRLVVFLLALASLGAWALAAGPAFGAAPQDALTYGPQAVWNPPEPVMQKWLGCKDFVCRQKVMTESGASRLAVDFLRQSKGHLMTSFAALGKVALAWGSFPGASYQGQYFLVNGRPSLLGVDDAAIEAKNKGTLDLSANPYFRRLLERRPKTGLWQCREFEGEDSSKAGQRFIFSFYLKEGCNACPVAGLAYIVFDFNPNGKFLGINLVGLIALR